MRKEEEEYELIDYYIRMSWHKIARMYNNKANEHGVTNSIAYILMIVEKEGTPSTTLGPMMGMRPTSLSRTLKTMEDDDLIYRKQSEEDSRSVLIFLTEKGIKMRKIAIETIMDFNNTIKSKVSPAKLNGFYEVMRAINELTTEELKNENNKK